jgi:diguanylate cyclase (GGDEF)-like protein
MAAAGEVFTLPFVDLAEFKTINDLHGHKVSAEVLLEIGKRLKAGVGNRDLVARYGGDEFLVALRDSATLEGLRQSLEETVMTSVGALVVRADIGHVPFERGEDVDILLERTDAAMYARKRSAKLASA